MKRCTRLLFSATRSAVRRRLRRSTRSSVWSFRLGARLGARLGQRLDALRNCDVVVDVRGRGLLWGVRLPDARAPSTSSKRRSRAASSFLQSGVDGETILLSPPLVIEEAQLDRAVDIIECIIDKRVSSEP